jgi:hypothetical protein
VTGSSVGDAVHYARRRGFARTVAKLWRGYVAGREQWYVTRGDLTGWDHVPRRNPSLEIRPARQSDLPGLVRLGRQTSNTLRAWLRPEFSLFVAVAVAQPIAYRCLATRVHRWVAPFLGLGPGQIYSFDLFIDPRWRQRGVTQDIMAVTNPLLVARGFREVLSIQRTNNQESIAMTRARAIARLGTITRSVRFGRVRFAFTPADPDRESHEGPAAHQFG